MPWLAPVENAPVALGELCGGEETAEGIVNMRVGTSLVQNNVALGEGFEVVFDIAQEITGLIGFLENFAGGDVDDVFCIQHIHDIDGAVAVVIVVIEDADFQAGLIGLQGEGGDHQAVESAEAFGGFMTGMMKAGHRCGDQGFFVQGPACGSKHGAGGVGQAGVDFSRAGAETVVGSQIENIPDVINAVGAAEVGFGDGLCGANIQIRPQGFPGLHDETGFGGAGRKALCGGEHFGAEDDVHRHGSFLFLEW